MEVYRKGKPRRGSIFLEEEDDDEKEWKFVQFCVRITCQFLMYCLLILKQYIEHLFLTKTKFWEFQIEDFEDTSIQFSRNVYGGPPDTDEEYEEIERIVRIRENSELEFRDKLILRGNPLRRICTVVIRAISKEFNYAVLPSDEYSHYMKGYAEKDIRRTAFFSRILLLLLQILATFVLPEHENDGFKATGGEEVATGIPYLNEVVVNATLGGFTNWDGQYFYHIARNGYTHENTMAFFPLFPLTIGYLAKFFHAFLFPFMTLHSLILCTGWIFNTWCFLNAAVALSQLVELQSGRSRDLIPTVVYLFSYNPASIFFSAFYSESLFAWMMFSFIREIYSKNIPKSVLYASLSAICRSNGLTNFVLVGIAVSGVVLVDMRPKEVRNYYYPVTQFEPWNEFRAHFICFREILIFTLRLGVLNVLGLIPFGLFQFYCVQHFCDDDRLDYRKSYPDPNASEYPSYCFYQTLPYTYIQAENWNVGFLKYFELKQVPNFALAAPVLCTLSALCWDHIKAIGIRFRQKKFTCYPTIIEFVLGWHGIFFLCVCFFLVHVQISTRMVMSTCPYLYFLIARRLRIEKVLFLQREIPWTPVTFLVQMWFSFYFIIGTAAFSTGYPWT